MWRLWTWIIRMLYKLTRYSVGKKSNTTSDFIPSNSTLSENTEYHYYVTQQEDEDDDDNNVGLDINFLIKHF